MSDPLTNSSKFIVDAKSKYPDLEWLSLEDEMTALFQAMRMEKLAVSLILSVIIAVASFNIIASLVLSINKKRGDSCIEDHGSQLEINNQHFFGAGYAWQYIWNTHRHFYRHHGISVY